jgi:hypothetical protein
MADLAELRYFPSEEECKVRRTLQMAFARSPLPLDKASQHHIELLRDFHLDLRPDGIASIYGGLFAASDFYELFYNAFENSTVMFFDDDHVAFGLQNLQRLGMSIELHRNDSMVIVDHGSWMQLQDGDVFKIVSQNTEYMCMRYLFQIPHG